MKKVSASRGAVDTARAVYLKNYNPGAPPYEPKDFEFNPTPKYSFTKRANAGPGSVTA